MLIGIAAGKVRNPAALDLYLDRRGTGAFFRRNWTPIAQSELLTGDLSIKGAVFGSEQRHNAVVTAHGNIQALSLEADQKRPATVKEVPSVTRFSLFVVSSCLVPLTLQPCFSGS